ncbi:dihydroxyacetone kinase subunit DhaL [Tepidimicrobium xylanilyticum]|uniref:phosphoenolpyruvate--glycerone phosphotransferase n=1 Tax=Tepidimicrobium xylanilyticum TaxID=1123352 RepID=A0A1H3BBA9_9FIRM|nr:dihydroxyacetone kinase subunit DhaL [Tepidimicrobium xylanilyticum]SDX38978.1 dihydroxyacetone kinase DhaL subunit [Tepidimicrobium xylanilyticum]
MGDTSLLLEIVKNMSKNIIESKELLTELDRVIGDSDHGINMAKGFSAINDKLEEMEGKDWGCILKTVAMTLISTVGGASGPLYGTGFLRAATVVEGKKEIDKDDVVNMFDEAIKGIKMRGKSNRGDKTMLDALIPAYEALKLAYEEGQNSLKAFKRAEESALEGVEYTKTIIAKKGRASYLGERSLGHQDPGATSSYIIIKSITEILEKN